MLAGPEHRRRDNAIASLLPKLAEKGPRRWLAIARRREQTKTSAEDERGRIFGFTICAVCASKRKIFSMDMVSFAAGFLLGSPLGSCWVTRWVIVC